MPERRLRGMGLAQSTSLFVAVFCLAAGAGVAVHHPLVPLAALAAFTLWCVAVAWRPGIWLFVVPALLPLLNFAPWTGWVAFEEFDLLLLGVAAGGHAHLLLAHPLGACRAWGVEAKIGPSEDSFCRIRRLIAIAMGQEAGEKWTAAANLQPTLPKPDRLLALDRPARMSRQRAVFVGLAAVFAALGSVALLRGVASAPASATGDLWLTWFQGYTDPLNSWRVFKSLLHAALLWPLLRREVQRDTASAARRLAAGMLAGLAVVTLAVVWERTAYPGLWNFSSRYRTTALFWEMHVGGAAIDAYLALATPFVAWALWSARTPLRWAMAAGLALLTGYACLTTFSRGVYAAVAGPLLLLGWLLASRHVGTEVRAAVLRALLIGALVSCLATGLALAFDAGGYVAAGLLLLCLGLLLLALFFGLKRVLKCRLPPPQWRSMAALALSVALTLEIFAVLGIGSFMRERLAASDHDLGSRLVHWGNGLGLMQAPADWLWGIGLGRLPGAYSHGVPGHPFPGAVQWVPPAAGQNSGAVRVSGPKAGSPLKGLFALTQRVALRPGSPGVVEFDIRARATTDVYLRLCEMHLLYSRNCQIAWLRVEPGDADWHHLVSRLRGPALDAGPLWAPRLGVFSIAVVNAGGVADFDRFSLIGPDATQALANRDFSHGMAHWFAAAQGYFVPWHIDNLYLELLIERGVFALLAFVLFMGFALRRLVGAASRATPVAPFLAASLSGALSVGLVSSVMDVPRVAFLLFLIALFAVEITCAKLERPRAYKLSAGPSPAAPAA